MLRTAARFVVFVILLSPVAATIGASFLSVADFSVLADFASVVADLAALSDATPSVDVGLLDLSPGSGLLSSGTRSGGTGLSRAVDFALGAGDTGAGDGAGGDSVDFALGAGTVVPGDGVAVALDDGAGVAGAPVGGDVGRDATVAFDDGERVTSSRYGALIATATANTINTSSARNHVVAKIERGGVSS